MSIQEFIDEHNAEVLAARQKKARPRSRKATVASQATARKVVALVDLFSPGEIITIPAPHMTVPEAKRASAESRIAGLEAQIAQAKAEAECHLSASNSAEDANAALQMQLDSQSATILQLEQDAVTNAGYIKDLASEVARLQVLAAIDKDRIKKLERLLDNLADVEQTA